MMLNFVTKYFDAPGGAGQGMMDQAIWRTLP